MSWLRTTEMQYRAMCKVKYRYTCIRCEHVTKWFRCELEQFASHRQKSPRLEVKAMHDINDLEKTEAQAVKQLRKLRGALRKMVARPNSDMLPDHALLSQFDEIFGRGKKCPNCKKRQPWYPAAAFLAAREKNPSFMGPEVVWGRTQVELIGMPSQEEYDVANETEHVVPGFVRKLIAADNAQIMNMRYMYMCKIEHPNILRIHDTQIVNLGTIAIQEEVFEGTTLAEKLEKGICENDFCDYVLQLCDALEYLHKQGLAHNAVCAQNILINENNILKLINFDDVTPCDSYFSDISSVGTLIRDIKEDFIHNYIPFAKNCYTKYKTMDDFRKGFIKPPKTSYGVVISIVVGILFLILLISNRIL